jgi:hypothetical protein
MIQSLFLALREARHAQFRSSLKLRVIGVEPNTIAILEDACVPIVKMTLHFPSNQKHTLCVPSVVIANLFKYENPSFGEELLFKVEFALFLEWQVFTVAAVATNYLISFQ